jgi:oligosaccharide repeat unit polymerase
MILGILLTMGLFFYIYFFKKTHDSLNPIGIFLLVWCFTAAVSNLYLNPLQEKWNYVMIFVVISSALAVFSAGLIVIHQKTNIPPKKDIIITNTFKIMTRIIFLISLLCVFIEWKQSGYILPGLDFSSNGSDKKALIKGIPFIHYGSILMPFCGIFAFFELKHSKESKLYNLMVIFISVVFYSFMFSISRGTLIGLFLSFLFIQHHKKPISIKRLFILFSIIISVFVGMSFLRIPKGSLVFQMVNGNDLFIYFSPVYSYIAFNFENLLKLINSDHSYTFFQYSLLPLWDLMGFREELNITMYDTEFFNARTYLYAFYHDMGIIGTIIFPFLIGFVVSVFYKKMQFDPNYVLLLAVLQKAIVMAFFGNYFFAELVIIWPYVITFILLLSLKYKIKFN